MLQSRQLAAIMFTDIVGYTAMMQQSEQNAVAVIKHYNTTLEKWVKHFNGRVLNYYGDGSLCIFSSATDAVDCSLAVQKDLKSDPIVPLRIGLHIGEIFFEEEKALGDGVNVASRVQSLGQGNTILISSEIHDKIKNNSSIKTVSLGHFNFKNVDKPLEIFALTNEGLFIPQRKKMEGKLKEKNVLWRNVLISLLTVLFLVAAFVVNRNFLTKRDAVDVTDKSIAVLPFVNMSNDPEQEYFSDGLSEELLNLLSKIPELKVIARTSSFSFKGKNEDIRTIGEKLGVALILEGSVRKSGNKLRVSAQLIRAVDGSHIWSETYERETKDIFELQAEISQDIVVALSPNFLTDKNSVRGVSPTKNIEAYNLYLKAKYFYNRQGIEGNRLAMTLSQEAIKLDPEFSLAYSVLANTFSLIAYYEYHEVYDVKRAREKAFEAATKAIALNPLSAEAHDALGYALRTFRWNWSEAEREVKIAISLDPKVGHWRYSLLLAALGRMEESIEEGLTALQLDPLGAEAISDLARIYYYAGQHDKAVETVNKVFQLEPNYRPAISVLACTLEHMGLADSSVVMVSKSKTRSATDYEGMPELFETTPKPYEEFWKEVLERSLKDSKVKPIPNMVMAILYIRNGDKEGAIRSLQNAFTNHEGNIVYVNAEPLFRSLHNDPRFIEIITSMGLKNN